MRPHATDVRQGLKIKMFQNKTRVISCYTLSRRKEKCTEMCNIKQIIGAECVKS